MIYEKIKYEIQETNGRYMKWYETIGNAIISKTISTLITYPYQVVRTRLQHVEYENYSVKRLPKRIRKKGKKMRRNGNGNGQNLANGNGNGNGRVGKGVLQVLKEIHRERLGILGFYRGVTVNLIRIFPGTCITFLVYETLKTRI